MHFVSFGGAYPLQWLRLLLRPTTFQLLRVRNGSPTRPCGHVFMSTCACAFFVWSVEVVGLFALCEGFWCTSKPSCAMFQCSVRPLHSCVGRAGALPRVLGVMRMHTSCIDSISHCTHLQLQRTIVVNFQHFVWALAGSSAKFVQRVRQN